MFIQRSLDRSLEALDFGFQILKFTVRSRSAEHPGLQFFLNEVRIFNLEIELVLNRMFTLPVSHPERSQS